VIAVLDELPEAVPAGDRLVLDLHVVSDRREPTTDLVAVVTAAWSDHGGEPILHTGWTGAVDADAVARVGTVRLLTPPPPDPSGASLEVVVELREGDIVLSRCSSTTLVTP
jgi:hypothetical protein